MLVFSTYLISCTVCLTLSIILFFHKGISSTSPKNTVYNNGKRLLAVSVALEAAADAVCLYFIAHGAPYMLLNNFFLPTMFYIQMCIMIIVSLTLLHSNKFTIGRSMLFTTPVVCLAAVHLGLYVCENGPDFFLPAYEIYLGSAPARIMSSLLDAAIICESAFCIYILQKKTVRFHRNIGNYVSGSSGERSQGLIYIVAAFAAFFVISAADFIVANPTFDIFAMWAKTIVLLAAAICAINIQGIYLDMGPAFAPKLERMIDPEDSTPPQSERDRLLTDEERATRRANIDSIIEQWVHQTDKPYLHESITINQVATQMGIGPRLLSQYINNVMHVNFNTWINKLKVEEAKSIIRMEPDTSITMLAVKAGFSDASAMSKIFKSITGVSPSVYKSKISAEA